ncbi:MAG: hypothetical protein AAF747_08530 [Planctomycetota bacterium]
MSRVVLIAEFVRDLPWSRTRWAVALARAYKTLGHEVTLIADGVDDAHELELLGVTVRVRRPLRPSEDTQPARFARFATHELAAASADVAISLTWLVPAAIWLPVEQAPWPRFRELVGEGSIVSLAFESVQQRWLPTAMLAAHRSKRSGATSIQTTDLGLAAIDRVPAEQERGAMRAGLRESLGIQDDERIVLASLVQQRPKRLADALAWADANKGRLLVLANEWYSIRRAFERAHMVDRLITLGTTREPGAAVAACDGVLLAGQLGTGRLAALAIAMGKPIESVRPLPEAITTARDVSLGSFAQRLLEQA